MRHLPVFLASLGLIVSTVLPAQAPFFGREIRVAINGYTLDAMEPALSADGNGLFFNSLNDGVTTSLYYATMVNDSTFNLAGMVPVVNQSVTPRLDGVASLDSMNNFYWVSTRGYPSIPYNVHRIRFFSTGYSNFGRVYGDFYHVGPGWIVMDVSVSYDGEELLYCNALFDSCAMNIPCKSTIRSAQKLNDSTFIKNPDSDQLLAAVNDTVDYIAYAPHLSRNGLELYYTRLFKPDPRTEVLVATRQNTASPFEAGLIIDDDTLSEGPVLDTGGDKLYYHKKTGNTFHLVLRYRQQTTGLKEDTNVQELRIFPNPTSGLISSTTGEPFIVFNLLGDKVLSAECGIADLSGLPAGIYLACGTTQRTFLKVIKE